MKKLQHYTILILVALLFSFNMSANDPYAGLIQPFLSQGIQIALVTNDPNPAINHNLVVWQRVNIDSIIHNQQIQDTIESVNEVESFTFDSLSINYYTIHRWNPTSSTYDNIGQLNYEDLPIFEDLNSDPKNTSYRYKITANISYQYTAIVDIGYGPAPISPPLINFDTELDSCRYHQTLLIKKEREGDIMHVHVSPYEVEGINLTELFQSLTGTDSIPVQICRHNDSSLVLNTPYDTIYYVVGDTISSFRDPDPNAFDTTWYYQGVLELLNPIDETSLVGPGIFQFKASSGPFSQSISNIEDNRLREDDPSGIMVVQHDGQYISGARVAPNPINNESMLHYTVLQKGHVSIKAMHISGKTTQTLFAGTQEKGLYSLALKDIHQNLPSGLLILYIQNGQEITTVKTIKP